MSSDDRKSPKDQQRPDDQTSIKDLDAKKGKNDDQVMGGRATDSAVAKKSADLRGSGQI
jgi:hypothetical protein